MKPIAEHDEPLLLSRLQRMTDRAGQLAPDAPVITLANVLWVLRGYVTVGEDSRTEIDMRRRREVA